MILQSVEPVTFYSFVVNLCLRLQFLVPHLGMAGFEVNSLVHQKRCNQHSRRCRYRLILMLGSRPLSTVWSLFCLQGSSAGGWSRDCRTGVESVTVQESMHRYPLVRVSLQLSTGSPDKHMHVLLADQPGFSDLNVLQPRLDGYMVLIGHVNRHHGYSRRSDGS